MGKKVKSDLTGQLADKLEAQLKDQANSFPVNYNQQSEILILGSVPGQFSLKQQQYYAHPRNGFWSIMSTILNFPLDLTYKEKLEQLVKHKIALWDVLASCQRKGSLDSSIQSDTIIVNDFETLLNINMSNPNKSSNIKKICFNGQKAAQLFKQHVLNNLPDDISIQFHTLPSTSPAHASMTLAEKQKIWQKAIQLNS